MPQSKDFTFRVHISNKKLTVYLEDIINKIHNGMFSKFEPNLFK